MVNVHYTNNDLNRALILAASAHDGQLDKQGKPYIFHVLEVARPFMLTDSGLYMVALLHDVVEDTDITLYQIEEQFGLWMRKRIDSLTHRNGETYADYLSRVCQDISAVRVKIEDVRHNLSRIDGIEDRVEYDRLWKKYSNALWSLQQRYREYFVEQARGE